MANLLDRFKEGAKSTLNQLSVPIPITTTMLQKLLNASNIEGITDLEVDFIGEGIQISGKAKKLVTFPFSLVLLPDTPKGRKMYFTVSRLKPLNAEWIRTKVLNVPPVLLYENETVCIDLNGLDAIAKVPVGTIRFFKIEDNILWVTIGV